MLYINIYILYTNVYTHIYIGITKGHYKDQWTNQDFMECHKAFEPRHDHGPPWQSFMGPWGHWQKKIGKLYRINMMVSWQPLGKTLLKVKLLVQEVTFVKSHDQLQGAVRWIFGKSLRWLRCAKVSKAIGGFNPIRLDHETPGIGVKINNIWVATT